MITRNIGQYQQHPTLQRFVIFTNLNTYSLRNNCIHYRIKFAYGVGIQSPQVRHVFALRKGVIYE